MFLQPVRFLVIVVLFLFNISQAFCEKTKNIIFDFGGVLVNVRPSGYSRKLSFMHRTVGWKLFLTGKVAKDLALELILQEIPEMDDEEKAALCQEAKNYWHDIVEKDKAPLEKGVSMLEAAKADGYNIYLLSNMPLGDDERFTKIFPFYSYFQGKILSCDVGCLKPEEKIYKLLFETYKLKPEECLFIDDRKNNVVAGVACGMPGIFWNVEKTSGVLYNKPTEKTTKIVEDLHLKDTVKQALSPYLNARLCEVLAPEKNL